MIKIEKDRSPIYLDACASTPMHKKVVDEMHRINTDFYGNPSSLHKDGIQAAEILELSRLTIADKLGCSYNEVLFTSGATESIHLALKGTTKYIKPGRIIISSVEHPSVESAAISLKEKGWEVDYWPVDDKGNIKIEYTDKLLTSPTNFVSAIWAQSEIGTIQPILKIGKECERRKIIFHTDATQILPNTSLTFKDMPIDLLSGSAHKFQGPKGLGLLLMKRHLADKIHFIQGGGLQEFGLRSGTEPVPLIAGAAKAIKLVENNIEITEKKTILKPSYVSLLTKALIEGLSDINELIWTGNPYHHNRLPNHLSFVLKDKSNAPISSRNFVRQLSNKGVYISTGSACSISSKKNSPVLTALGLQNDLLQSGIRLSLGPWLDYDQINIVPELIKECLSSI